LNIESATELSIYNIIGSKDMQRKFVFTKCMIKKLTKQMYIVLYLLYKEYYWSREQARCQEGRSSRM